METLDTLIEFVNEYPQIDEGMLQYVFIGGTAVRLNQEKKGKQTLNLREISDFDILRFSRRTYPVHQFGLEEATGITSLPEREIYGHIVCTDIKEKSLSFMDATFLALTKTCATDNPREKDYRDILSLYKLGLVDLDELANLFGKTERITKNATLIGNSFRWFLENDYPDAVRLFQTFPALINLMSEFQDPYKVRGLFLDYLKEDKKPGFELNSVVRNIHSVINEVSPRDRLVKLNELLDLAKKEDYTEFDREINTKLLPRLLYHYFYIS